MRFWTGWFCLVALPLFAGTAFEEARSLYDQNQFASALERYLAIEGQSAPLDYNIGNTLMRLGRPQEAVAYYRRAQWQDPGDADIRANFDRAISETGAWVPPLPLPRRMTGILDAGEWQALFLISCWAVAGFGIAGLFFRQLRKLFLWILPLAGIWLFAGAAGVWFSRPSLYFQEAVLSDLTVTVHFEPLSDSTEHFSLPGGSVVQLIEKSRDWYKISAGDREGWVRENQVWLLKQLGKSSRPS
ncbi:MAG: SH3 domain-containing protein [Kiritimatiellia bacterium]